MARTTWTSDDALPRDPDAHCERCGARGTAARLTLETVPRTVRRYCWRCWPGVRAEFRAREDAEAARHQAAWLQWVRQEMGEPGHAPEPPRRPGWTMHSRVWEDVRDFLALIARPPQGGPAPTAAHLAEIARDIAARAAKFEDPVPPDIEAFVARHHPPAA